MPYPEDWMDPTQSAVELARRAGRIPAPILPFVTSANGDAPTYDPGDPYGEAEAIRQALPRIDWHDLWAAKDDDEDWVVFPLLPARRLVALYSAPKVGKSLLMLEIAAGVTCGREVLGWRPERARRVLYVDFENDPKTDTRERLQDMGYGPGQLDNLVLLSFPTLGWLDTPVGGAELLAAVAAYDVEVVVIDTVSRAVRGEENENDTWLAFYRHTGLKLKQIGVACIRLDHSGKDAAKGQRGGSAKSGDVDAVWHLTKLTDTKLQLKADALRFALAVGWHRMTLERGGLPFCHTVISQHAMTVLTEEAVKTLDRLGVPTDLGKIRVRTEWLVPAGESLGNNPLNEAIQYRRARETGPKPVRGPVRADHDADRLRTGGEDEDD